MRDESLMLEALNALSERWWVGFTDRNEFGWLGRLLTRPGKRHCFIFTDVGDDKTMIYDPLRGRALLYVVEMPVREVVSVALEDGADLLIVERQLFAHDLLRFPLRRRSPLLTCASSIAYMLALEGWIHSPQRLWRALLEAGAQEVRRNGSGSTIYRAGSGECSGSGRLIRTGTEERRELREARGGEPGGGGEGSRGSTEARRAAGEP